MASVISQIQSHAPGATIFMTGYAMASSGGECALQSQYLGLRDAIIRIANANPVTFLQTFGIFGGTETSWSNNIVTIHIFNFARNQAFFCPV